MKKTKPQDCNLEQVKWIGRLFAQSKNGLLITDAKGQVVQVNAAFSSMSGYSRDEILGQSPSVLQSGKHDDAYYRTMWHCLHHEGYWSGEIINRRKDGALFSEWLSIHTLKDRENRITHYVGSFFNLTHLKNYQHQLEQQAHYDPLTRLPNRVLLNDRVRQAIAWVQRLGTLVAVCHLNLEGLTDINQRYGHLVGDQVLYRLAERLNQLVRAGDTLARVAGDEFVLILPDVDSPREVRQILDRLKLSLSLPLPVDPPLTVDVAIGLALYPDDCEDPASLLDHAYQAMCVAKQQGQGAVHVFDPSRQDLYTNQQEAVVTLREALSADQCTLYFQPIIDLQTDQIEGIEALIRWQHPVQGLLLPDNFLPGDSAGADYSALAIEVDLWAIEAALKQMQTWEQQQIDLPVSVNISQRLLHWPDLPAQLAGLIARYPTRQSLRLELEVAENTALNDLMLTRQVVESCNRLGIGFTLDDFGTSYGAISYLKHLPVHALKIDVSFIRGLLSDAGDAAVVASIVGIGRAFGLKVIAKGVEDEAQIHALLDKDCALAQGFKIADPMPAGDLERWLATRAHLAAPSPRQRALAG